MANKNLWSRICEAFGGSKKKQKAEAEAKRQEALRLVEAIHALDVKTAHAMLEAGCDVNYVFSRERMYMVDMDVYTVKVCYTPIECSEEPMTTLLRAYGGMTYDEYRAAEEKKSGRNGRQSTMLKWRSRSARKD